MINIKTMKAKDWKNLKEDLETRLNEVGWRFIRVIRTGEKTVVIEGGSVPVYYNIEANECAVWNKCSRYSGGFTSIESLMRVNEVLEDWGNKVCQN